MGYEDTLWEIMCDCVNYHSGEIIIPTTGGLDSRILSGIIEKKGYISNWTYWFRCPDNKINEDHIIKLSEIQKKHLIIIDVPSLPEGFKYGMGKLNEKALLKHHRIAIPFHMDVMAGMLKSRKKERFYFQHTYPAMEEKFYPNYSLWGEVLRPFDNPRLIGYILSLPRKDRMFENCYIKMLNKYLPELAEVPRCFEKGTGGPTPVHLGMTTYIGYRLFDRMMR